MAPAAFLELLTRAAEAGIVAADFGSTLEKRARLLEEAVDASDRGGDQLGGLFDQGFHILAPLGLERMVTLCVGDVDGNGRDVVPVFPGLQQGLPPVRA